MRTIEEKLIDYLNEHKKPVTIKQMAKYFIASDGAVQRAFANLSVKGVVQIVPKSKPYLYRAKL
jgi:Mn-dependent DtxR family transcriptional regulator